MKAASIISKNGRRTLPLRPKGWEHTEAWRQAGEDDEANAHALRALMKGLELYPDDCFNDPEYEKLILSLQWALVDILHGLSRREFVAIYRAARLLMVVKEAA